MNSYPAGSPVKLVLPIVDHDGNPVEPAGLNVVVYDLDDNVVVAAAPLTLVPGDTDVEVTVAGSDNQAPDGETLVGRQVILTITTPEGVYRQTEVYALRPFRRLLPPRNSFLADAAAQVLAADIPGIEALTAVDATMRQAALIEAHARITRNAFAPERGCDTLVLPEDWAEMSSATFLGLPAAFRRALGRAQLQEAGFIVNGDPIGKKRRAGILSETIGESSMMFQGGRASREIMSSETLSELSAYIVRRTRIARA